MRVLFDVIPTASGSKAGPLRSAFAAILLVIINAQLRVVLGKFMEPLASSIHREVVHDDDFRVHSNGSNGRQNSIDRLNLIEYRDHDREEWLRFRGAGWYHNTSLSRNPAATVAGKNVLREAQKSISLVEMPV